MTPTGLVFGLAAATAPTVAFVVANAAGGLDRALIVLGVTASAVFGARIARREPLRAAVAGVAVAAVYALVAALTGEARGFFLRARRGPLRDLAGLRRARRRDPGRRPAGRVLTPASGFTPRVRFRDHGGGCR